MWRTSESRPTNQDEASCSHDQEIQPTETTTREAIGRRRGRIGGFAEVRARIFFELLGGTAWPQREYDLRIP
jgi:hypothetical protein